MTNSVTKACAIDSIVHYHMTSFSAKFAVLSIRPPVSTRLILGADCIQGWPPYSPMEPSHCCGSSREHSGYNRHDVCGSDDPASRLSERLLLSLPSNLCLLFNGPTPQICNTIRARVSYPRSSRWLVERSPERFALRIAPNIYQNHSYQPPWMAPAT